MCLNYNLLISLYVYTIPRVYPDNICNVKLLGLAGGNTKERGNKKSGECPESSVMRHPFKMDIKQLSELT